MRYVWDKVALQLVEMPPREKGLPSVGPVVRSDIGGYRSPVDGRWVEGNVARREDLKRTGSIDAREKFGGSGRDPRFAAQREAARARGII